MAAKQKQSLELLAKEAADLIAAKPPKIVTEEGRVLAYQQLRIIETLLHGEPKTTLPSRHHG